MRGGETGGNLTERTDMAKITEPQKAELKRSCKEVRVPDESRAERRIRDLMEKAHVKRGPVL